MCVPDPDTDPEDEEDMLYNVVANPELEFVDNTFLEFSDAMLTFPGANNVPLGSLEIKGNKVGTGAGAGGMDGSRILQVITMSKQVSLIVRP